jgi:hypothetical protein
LSLQRLSPEAPAVAPRAAGYYHDEFGEEQRRHYGTEFLAYAAAAAAVAGAATAAYGTYKQGQDAAAASKYNEAVAFRQADQARDQAAIRAEEQALQDRRAQATVRARLGASGVEVEGSPLLVLMANADQAQLDQERIKYGGEITASGLEARGRLEGAYGRTAQTAGAIGAGASLLGSAGRIASTYLPTRTAARAGAVWDGS